ncbi:nucleoside triphosphate pyrophosphohydrolase [Ilumatobacter sp.]|uniref:nucleoside triphosphate pyrophosphohydrolase n=1 Tax=Ilumatobacter sp. TaxID=1967498 RepID=UPI003B52EE0B
MAASDDGPRIVVVGLGPGAGSHVTAETLDEIERAQHRHLRTAVHPCAHLLIDAAERAGGDRRDVVTHDDLYESADRFDDVYVEIARRLRDEARRVGEILYAVPGSPLVLERTVRLLLESADDEGVSVDVRPAMSFLDVAWARLGVDPVEEGVRLVDGHEFATAAAGEPGPLLVAHAHADWVLSDIKLAVEDATGDESVTILQALGTDDELVVETTWSELDRTVEADHLTSLWIPRLGAPIGRHQVRFHELVRTLRERCPWDVEQTHDSLVPYLLEETYEVVDALAGLDEDDPSSDDDLVEELGDLLYQIEFHAAIAEQEGRFTISDVVTGIHDKLVRRHPHVFGDVRVDDAAAASAGWDAIKRAEKAHRRSIFDGIPRSMPALSSAAATGRAASKVGFDWADVTGAVDKIAEETAELLEAIDGTVDDEIVDELGDLLFAVVNVARHCGVDPELALRRSTDEFRARVTHVESVATERGVELRSADPATLDELWEQAKRR